jgi:hypothetical protein
MIGMLCSYIHGDDVKVCSYVGQVRESLLVEILLGCGSLNYQCIIVTRVSIYTEALERKGAQIISKLFCYFDVDPYCSCFGDLCCSLSDSAVVEQLKNNVSEGYTQSVRYSPFTA